MRRLEFVGKGSSKFWEIGLQGCDLIIRWGRIGTRGQEMIKHFPDAMTAEQERSSVSEDKTKKGYREVVIL
jgi:predicted DNA-binding WGR domain protein